MAKPRITILLTCVGGRLVYDFVSALRAAEDFLPYIIGIDALPEAEGRVLCDEFHVFPMAEDQEEAYLQRLLSLHWETPIDVLIPLSEGESRLVAKHKSTIEQAGMKTSVSQYEIVAKMTDKGAMLSHLSKAGIEVGPYCLVEALSDFENALDLLGYPDQKIILKPRKGRGSRGVMIIDKTQDSFVSLLPNRFCGTGSAEVVKQLFLERNLGYEDLIAMPYYHGDTYDVDCIVDQGKRTDICTRLRQLKNPLWPTSTGHKVQMNAAVISYIDRVCAAFGISGAGDFDVIVNEGKPMLIDAAARFSGSVGETFVAGANFPAQLVRSLLGLKRVEYTIQDNLPLRPFITMAPIPLKNEGDLL